jgi:hypothetical protein
MVIGLTVQSIPTISVLFVILIAIFVQVLLIHSVALVEMELAQLQYIICRSILQFVILAALMVSMLMPLYLIFVWNVIKNVLGVLFLQLSASNAVLAISFTQLEIIVLLNVQMVITIIQL